MPLIAIPGPEALQGRRNNHLATWGNRAAENRIEPIARPAFEVPFKFNRKERIFTIGSCFARHVEDELLRLGFRVPMRELFAVEEFRNLATEIVNNFGVPSIFNELAWAFGEEEYDETLGFAEVANDKYVDLHIVNSVRPAPLEIVRARRRALGTAINKIAQCRVVIMTLGLAELWWDDYAQRYLNTAPLPSLLSKDPLRFALHVLSYDECYDYLQRAMDLIFRRAGRKTRIILTVSPVPMAATHRNEDVITANTYSKSVLRSVAEQIVASQDNISYFPSYETVMLSDRRASWDDDLVHVRRQMVTFNVERMVNAFMGNPETSESLEMPGTELIEDSAALLFAERARQARNNGDAAFFKQHATAATTSRLFALELARFHFDCNFLFQALQALEPFDDPETDLLRCQIQFKQEEFHDAIETGKRVAKSGNRGHGHWKVMLDSAVEIGEFETVLEIEKLWHKHEPRRSTLINAFVARALHRLDLIDEASARAERALDSGDSLPFFATVDFAKIFILQGDSLRAMDLLDRVKVNKLWQAKQIEKVRAMAAD